MAHTPRHEDDVRAAAGGGPPAGPAPVTEAGLPPAHTEESAHAVELPETLRTEQIEGSLTRELRPTRVVPRWIGWMVIGAGAVMLPWIAGLIFILPTRHEAAHYDASWIGFDIVLCAMLIRTGWLAQKGREHIELSAAMTGTLLLVDAWFDVVTADSPREQVIALVLAIGGEVPLAAFCLWIAGRVEFRRQRRAEALSRLMRQWAAHRPDHPGALRRRRGSSGAGERPDSGTAGAD